MSRWRPTKRGLACAACGDTGGYCTVSPDGDVCQCRHGVTGPHAVKQRDGTVAYLHPMAGGKAVVAKRTAPSPKPPKLNEAELQRITKRQQNALADAKLAVGCKALGLSAESLRAYGVGYDEATDALSFPMYDGRQKVIGVRLRQFGTGRKMCVPGSSNGLFIPVGFDVARVPDSGIDDPHEPMMLTSPEGPTDAAALWACGFAAVGMPNNDHGGDMLAELLRRCNEAKAPRDLVVIEDADAVKWAADGITPLFPGRYGALVRSLPCVRHAASLRIVTCGGAKDARAALVGLGDAARLGCVMVVAIAAADPLTEADVKRKLAAVDRTKEIVRGILAGRTFIDASARDAARAEALQEARVKLKAESRRKAVANAA